MWLVPPLLHLSSTTCSHHYTFSLSRPGLSLWQVPPCVSPFLSIHLPYPHHPHIAYTSHLYTPATTSLLARLVIVAGPAYPPHFQHLTTLSPSSSSYYHPPLPTLPLELHSGPACHCGRSRHIILSRYISHTSFLALPPTNINLQAYSTSPPSYRPGLPLWLVSPFPITYSFSPLYPHTSSSPIVTWPGLSLW